jgi:hypothetical protein
LVREVQGLPGCCDEDIGIGELRLGRPADRVGGAVSSSDEVDVPLRPLLGTQWDIESPAPAGSAAGRVGSRWPGGCEMAARASTVSAETACENLHKAFPRVYLNPVAAALQSHDSRRGPGSEPRRR